MLQPADPQWPSCPSLLSAGIAPLPSFALASRDSSHRTSSRQASLLSLAFLPPFPPLRADWSALGQLCRLLAYVFLAPPSLPARNLPAPNATPAGNERATVVPLGYLRASIRLPTPVRSAIVLHSVPQKTIARSWHLTLAEVSNTNALCTWYTEPVLSLPG